MKRILYVFAMIMVSYSLSFAGEMAAKEGTNYYNEGVQAQKEQDFQKADSLYQKTLLVDPSNQDFKKFITNNAGVMYMELGDLETAEAAFKEVLGIDPEYTPAKMNLGLVYDQQGDRLKALEYWAKVFNWEEQKPKKAIISEQTEPLPEPK